MTPEAAALVDRFHVLLEPGEPLCQPGRVRGIDALLRHGRRRSGSLRRVVSIGRGEAGRVAYGWVLGVGRGRLQEYCDGKKQESLHFSHGASGSTSAGGGVRGTTLG